MTFTIRKMRVGDLKRCSEINHYAWTVDFKDFSYMAPPPITDVPDHSLVALDGDYVIGYISWYYDEQGLFIHMLYVDKNYRRKGVGSSLIRSVTARADVELIRLYSHVEDADATMFYKNCNFIVKSELVFRDMPVYEMMLRKI